MDRGVWVYVDLEQETRLAGRLWTRSRRGQESASFEYDRHWLADSQTRFALEPALALDPGPFHTPGDRSMFGAIGDSAPDRWGRALMRRAERRRAALAGEAPRALSEVDYVLRVSDFARQGALRFALEQGGGFIASNEEQPIPPLIALPRLLAAADHVADDSDDDEDLRMLLAPGSSLGGARPKASVIDREGRLCIAKFPHRSDELDTVRWEAVALQLAERAGIAVATFRLEAVAERPVLLLQRFDRDDAKRVPFLSAMSMLGASDGEVHSYLELVDALRRYGAAPEADMRALWRRIVFSVLISNTDDHLRNHGFLYRSPSGWRLSPAYDLNPVPTDIKPRLLSTAIDLDDTTASLELAYEVAPYFELDGKSAEAIVREVGRVVADWRATAVRLGLSRSEIDRIASAFEHEDLEATRRT